MTRLSPLRPRFLHGCCFLWMSVVGGRFLAPFLEHELGLSDAEIGVALAVEQCVCTLLSSSGGMWADALERKHPGKGRAQVMGLGVIVATLVYLMHGLSSASFAPDLFQSAAWHICLRGCFAMSIALVLPVLDGITISFLNNHQDWKGSEDYGKERLYGALCWAVGHIILAPLLDYEGFTISYPLAILAGVAFLVTIVLYVRTQEPTSFELVEKVALEDELEPENNVDEVEELQDGSSSSRYSVIEEEDDETAAPEEKIPTSHLVRLLVASTLSIAFLVGFLCLSSGQAIVDGLVFLYFEFLGGSYTVMGWTVVLQVAFELPIFHYASQLLELLGSSNLLLLAGLCYVTRVLGYTCISQGNMIFVMLLEPFHGLTFASSQTAVVDFVAKCMPIGYEASGQGFVHLIRGLGSMVALVTGGWAEQTFGPHIMYRGAALVVAVGMALLATVLLWQRQKDKSNHHPPSQDRLASTKAVN